MAIKYKSNASFYSETQVHFNQGEEIEGGVYFSLTQRDKGFFEPFEVADPLPAPPAASANVPVNEPGAETGEVLIGGGPTAETGESGQAVPAVPVATPELTPAPVASQVHKETLLQHINNLEDNVINWLVSARNQIERFFEGKPLE